ncbi:hypothetical protein QFW82_16190 [Streptomyces malaysiensis subsp. malaysiensis]|uniref:DUF6879 domain-containing protein n=1 Tax=Streptomyces autolyticus TaxID=75293 RepID=A0ABN4WA45_9ACTN|nr:MULTISPECIES: DUF6879 family protein [Streptomyces]AQA14143.1 hypothetical protein BV401_30755 [Streptomyces autolyticus]MCM3807739.1 hypothetical protein [Streptomyces sp. DR7-3]WHX18477.1 hypothetical protein QFW82_16190 [Streptomyces sp. NA07423]
MLDIPVPPLDPAKGDWLELNDYADDFGLHYEQTRNHDSWKLERKQYFKESNSPSWNAFHRGDLAEAQRLLKDRAPALREESEEAASRGSVFRRVRIAAQPLTPYLQWELRSLRVRSESGEPVRVVPAAAVSHLESERPLPELVVLGGRVLYQVMYTEESAPSGAIRFTDPASVEQWEKFIANLFAAGEDITSYVEREVAHLAPPSGD